MDKDYKYEQVWRLLEQNQTNNAIELLKDLLGSEPNNAMYHGTLSYCLLEQVRVHAAEYELKIAMQLDPNNAFFHTIYARIYFLQNKVKQALAACDEALQFDPQSLHTFELKASILLANKRSKEALQYIMKMAELASNHINTVYSLANYYHQINDQVKAMEHVLEALRINAQHQNSNILMGKLQLLQGNMEEAEYHARLTIMLNPNSSEALTLFADLKMRKNIFMGLWWRLNAKISKMSQLNQVGVLIFGFVFFNLLSIIVGDLGYTKASSLIGYAWLGIVIYSWVAIPIYQNALKKEMQTFTFKSNY